MLAENKLLQEINSQKDQVNEKSIMLDKFISGYKEIHEKINRTRELKKELESELLKQTKEYDDLERRLRELNRENDDLEIDKKKYTDMTKTTHREYILKKDLLNKARLHYDASIKSLKDHEKYYII